jgi:lipopolysaccharide transport system ATP-binding protein
MSDIAIRVKSLSKQYKITTARYQHDTLRDQLVHSLKSIFQRNGHAQLSPGNHLTLAPQFSSSSDTFWALQDVSFEVKQGDIVGIIGRNGAGKSTLLKILSRVTEPTAGRAELYGRVGSLLEVGTGFDRELSGRENIYLNGAILGMRKAEIDRKFDEIVAFAEVERFIDTPVKRYSSGMYLRLAFAVAAHLEPEILLVDEVLAVGDAAFQKKCLGKMGEVAKKGRTILFVSHNMAAITHFCKWGIWLNNGQVQAHSHIEDIVARYLTSGVQECGEVTFPDQWQQAPGSEYVRLLAVRVKNKDDQISSSLDSRLPFTIEIQYRVLRRGSNLRIGLTLTTYDGVALLSSTDTDTREDGLEREPGVYVNQCTIPGDFLNYGQYFVSVGSDSPMIQAHFLVDRVFTFHIEQTGGVAGSIPDSRQGLLRLRLPWNIQKCDLCNDPEIKTFGEEDYGD